MYIYEQDPGHGWLGVPLLELVKLRIADKISQYSYHQRQGDVIWLEEDCDMTTFILAKLFGCRDGWKAMGDYRTDEHKAAVSRFFDEQIQERSVEHTRIRNMPGYDYELLKHTALAKLGETA